MQYLISVIHDRAGLAAPETATVIDNRGEAALVTDGPFLESKEYLAGFWIIQAPDLDIALKLAADGSKACNRKVEVRPLAPERTPASGHWRRRCSSSASALASASLRPHRRSLGDAKPDEAGSASGSFSSIQQLASAIGSAAVASIFVQAATSGMAHAMEVTLVVVLALTVLSLPVVTLMPGKAASEPMQ